MLKQFKYLLPVLFIQACQASPADFQKECTSFMQVQTSGSNEVQSASLLITKRQFDEAAKIFKDEASKLSSLNLKSSNLKDISERTQDDLLAMANQLEQAALADRERRDASAYIAAFRNATDKQSENIGNLIKACQDTNGK